MQLLHLVGIISLYSSKTVSVYIAVDDEYIIGMVMIDKKILSQRRH